MKIVIAIVLMSLPLHAYAADTEKTLNGRSLSSWVKQSKDLNPGDRTEAYEALQMFGGQEAHDALVDAVNYEANGLFKVKAIWALQQQMGREKANPETTAFIVKMVDTSVDDGSFMEIIGHSNSVFDEVLKAMAPADVGAVVPKLQAARRDYQTKKAKTADKKKLTADLAKVDEMIKLAQSLAKKKAK